MTLRQTNHVRRPVAPSPRRPVAPPDHLPVDDRQLDELFFLGIAISSTMWIRHKYIPRPEITVHHSSLIISNKRTVS